MPNNPFYQNPANPYAWNNNYSPGASYAPQTGGYMAGNGNQTPNSYQNQQLNRFQSIPGRLVNNLDEITPQEVPMDGSVSLFPTNDFSAIYAKTWTKDGTIATMKFIPEKQETAPTPNLLEEKINKIDKRISSLENRMNKFAKSRKNEEEPNE